MLNGSSRSLACTDDDGELPDAAQEYRSWTIICLLPSDKLIWHGNSLVVASCLGDYMDSHCSPAVQQTWSQEELR